MDNQDVKKKTEEEKMTSSQSKIKKEVKNPKDFSLPKDWIETTIDNISETVTDYLANGSFASLKENVTYIRNNGDYARLIRLTDHNKSYNKKDAVYVNKDSYEFLKKSKLFKKDIIISNVGEYSGTVFRVPNLEVPMTLGPNSILIRFKEDDNFMFYFLKSRIGQSLINSIKAGSANPKFNKTDFKKLSITIPPLPQQKAIASILSSFDDKIELLQKQNETLENIGQQVFKEWSDKSNEKENVDSILNFQKGIEVGSKNYFENKVSLKEAVKFYRVGDISENGKQSKVFTEKELIKDRDFNEDDVLVSFDGTVGRVFIGGNGGYSTGMRKVFAKKEYKFINNSFIYFWAKSKKVQEVINLYSEGTTIQHAGKSIKYLEIISNEKKVLKVQSELTSIFNKILLNLEQIQSLSKTRDILLPKLMKGEIRIK